MSRSESAVERTGAGSVSLFTSSTTGRSLRKRAADTSGCLGCSDLLWRYQRKDLPGDLQHPAGHRRSVIAGPVQLKAHHPWLAGLVDGVPAERQIAWQATCFRADIGPHAAVQLDTRDGGHDLSDGRGRADRVGSQCRVHTADISALPYHSAP